MNKKDLINEYIGIVAIIVIIILAVVAIYLYIHRQPADSINDMNNVTISLSQPNPHTLYTLSNNTSLPKHT